MFPVWLASDRSLLGPLANSRRRSVVLWALATWLLALGLTSAFGFLGAGV